MPSLPTTESVAPGPQLRTWRTTTAVRIFALALATGTVISSGSFVATVPMLVVLSTFAAASSLLEWLNRARFSHWDSVAEAIAVSVLLATTPLPGLGAYLAVPAVVAGIRHGLVSVLNVTMLAGLAAAASLAVQPGADAVARAGACLPWLVIGLGVGALASWQSRSMRTLVAKQAPYSSAHQLMARLHRLATSGALGLDSTSLVTDLDSAMRDATGAARTGIFVVGPDGRLRPLSSIPDAERLAQEIHLVEADRSPGAAVVALRGAHQVLGHCVLVGIHRWTPEVAERALEVADEFAVRLDTAVLFDEIRHLATAEERNRIARDMHDGVAQEIVALGYVVDEIETVTSEDDTRALAEELRKELSRVVTELRYSIFDLRHHVGDDELASALTDYVHDVGRMTDLRVHLVLDSSGPPLPPRTQSELMRIAQEAIGNVRRHAEATNLWVTLESDGVVLRLEVVDDGRGSAAPRDRHWGLQTMQERARGIGAELTIESATSRRDRRTPAGAVVALNRRERSS